MISCKINLLILSVWLMLFGCHNENKDVADNGKVVPTEQEIVEDVFVEIETLLNQDAGQFWGKSLYGPILLINPESRVFYSNRNNRASEFEKVGRVYKGTLPKEINIANTAVDWKDTRWTMVMLPLPGNRMVRNNLIIHELFHRLQPEIGFGNLQESNNGHLDSFDGRVLLRLELEALKKALSENNESKRITHIENALSFRLKRYTNKKIMEAENSLELNEGLAEYTGVMLSGRTGQQYAEHFISSINKFYDNQTFVRSFAYQTVPVYGYLLTSWNKDWHMEITSNTKLSYYFVKSFEIAPDKDFNSKLSAEENNYGYSDIVEDEKIRENQRLAKIDRYKTLFLKKPTLTLSFQNMNISFDPRNIIPFEGLGTIYPTLTVTDNWGVLAVENGALLSNDWSNVKVSEPTKIDSVLVVGDGWKLELNDGWKVFRQNNTYELKKIL